MCLMKYEGQEKLSPVSQNYLFEALVQSQNMLTEVLYSLLWDVALISKTLVFKLWLENAFLWN